ncbi:hypothetical protein [Streptomyces seoulensis]|nr:hypothetical protein [Streptomyces seoulensis]
MCSKLKPDWIACEPVIARLRRAIKRLVIQRNSLPDHEVEVINLIPK